MGYASETGLPLNADDLVRLLSSSPKSSNSNQNQSHTILVYFARGNLKGGDEARLHKLNVPTSVTALDCLLYRSSCLLRRSNTYIAHVVDVQPMYKKEFPEFDFYKTGKWLHSRLTYSFRSLSTS